MLAQDFIIFFYYYSSVSFIGVTEHLSMRGLHSCLSYPRGLALAASDKSMHPHLLGEEWNRHKHLLGSTAAGWGKKRLKQPACVKIPLATPKVLH